MKKNIKAFSLAEMMVVMCIMTIILASLMPIISKRVRLRPVITPTVVSTIPNVTQGQACTASINSIGLNSTNTTILTCQAGAWAPLSAGGIAGQILYTYGVEQYYAGSWHTVSVAPACPSAGSAGWIDLGTSSRIPGSYWQNNKISTVVRTCYTNKSCAVYHIYSSSLNPSCQAGWTNSDIIGSMIPAYSTDYVYACYKCN